MRLFQRIFSVFGLGRTDRRASRRRDLKVPADFSQGSEDAELFSQTENVSETGAFIQTNDPLPPGSPITVDFTIYLSDDRITPGWKTSVKAEVVHAVNAPGRGSGMGVRFLEPESDETSGLLPLLQSGGWKTRPIAKVRPGAVKEKEVEMQISAIQKDQSELAVEVQAYKQEPAAKSAPKDEAEPFLDEKEMRAIEDRMQEDESNSKGR